MALIQMNVMSRALMRTVNVTVVLPADKFKEDGTPVYTGKFKTLYLLHGVFGSQLDWLSGTRVQRWAQEKNLCVVMPAGENMFYVDQKAPHNYYGEFVGKELVELTRRMFPLSDRREDTFICGLSMGGYGALRNGMKYPENFGYVAGLSSANIIKKAAEATNDSPNFLSRKDYVEAVFGPCDKVLGSDCDILALAEKNAEAVKADKDAPALARIFLACGVDDGLLSNSQDLRDGFEKLGYDVTYEEGPGSHEWDFWDRYIKKVIDWLPVSGQDGINSGNIGSAAKK